MTRYLTVVWVLATELVMGSGRSPASLGHGYYGICIQIMPKTGGNSRPVGRPGWFLLFASDQYFKRAWSNTFDFLPLHWQNQHLSASRPAFNRNKPRASHF